MGCACLRGGGHHWPDRGAGRVAARGRQDGSIAHQPDAAGPHARSQLLRGGGDADAVWLGESEGQPDAAPVDVGQPVGDRDRQRLRDAMPIAVCDGVTIAERQRETLGLALGPLQQSFESVQE